MAHEKITHHCHPTPARPMPGLGLVPPAALTVWGALLMPKWENEEAFHNEQPYPEVSFVLETKVKNKIKPNSRINPQGQGAQILMDIVPESRQSAQDTSYHCLPLRGAVVGPRNGAWRRWEQKKPLEAVLIRKEWQRLWKQRRIGRWLLEAGFRHSV